MEKIHYFYNNENVDVFFWEEALKCFHKENTILHLGKFNNKVHIINMFIDKLNIQKITGSKKVFGYEDLITDLKKNNEQEIRMINMYCDNCMFILFSNIHNQVISILKSENSNSTKIINLIKQYKEYRDIDYLFFMNGVKTDLIKW